MHRARKSTLKGVEMAAKQEEKGKAVTARKSEVKSSMQFIREAVGKNHEIAFEKLVAAVKKAGYETKEISIRAEWLKSLRNLGKKPAKKAVGREGREEGRGWKEVQGGKPKATPATPQAKEKGKASKAEDESCTGLTDSEVE